MCFRFVCSTCSLIANSLINKWPQEGCVYSLLSCCIKIYPTFYCQDYNIDIFLSRMEVISFLIGDIVLIYADIQPVSVCVIAGWYHFDDERCFRIFWQQLVKSCWNNSLFSFQCLLFQGFQRCFHCNSKSMDFLCLCILRSKLYNPFQKRSCIVGGI